MVSCIRGGGRYFVGGASPLLNTLYCEVGSGMLIEE